MKNTLFITLLTFISINTFGQDSTVVESEITNETLDMFYILDDIFVPNQTKTWEPDESPNYLQVTQGQSQLTGRIRGRVFFLLGDVDGYKKGLDENGNSVTSFFVRGREQSTGALMSYEIIEKTDGSTFIHSLL